MNDQIQHSDRFEAPAGSRFNRNNLIIGILIAALILAFGYISISSGTEVNLQKAQSYLPSLHTEPDSFKMPEFKKPVPIVKVKKEVVAVKEKIIEAEIQEEKPVLPVTLPKIVSVAPIHVVSALVAQKEVDPDLERRLEGAISGGSDLGLSSDSSTKTVRSSDKDSALLLGQETNTANDHRVIKQGNSSRRTPQRAEHSSIDLSSSITHASLATRLGNLQYLVKKGTFINCVLTTNIQSDQAGFIKCTVTEDIYSADGTLVLIDRGSEILGEYKPESLTIGKERLHAVWDEVTTPTGVRVSLRSPSVGRLGSTGISGNIDNHWAQRLGVPILLSLFRSSVDYHLDRHSRRDGINYYESGDIAADRIEKHYQQYKKIRPTLRKNAGSTIGIILVRDVSFESVYRVMQR